MNTKRILILASTLIALLAASCLPLSYWFTVSSLDRARRDGVYATPQEGAEIRANRYYCGVEKIQIDHASTNSFDGSNPHIWYVIWTVYADHRAPCDPQHPGPPLYHNREYERGGNFYLSVKDGWVMMPEGNLPEFLGFWMKVFDLAGPGDPFHIPREGWLTEN